MYLIDTNIISESRKGLKANSGVRSFFSEVASTDTAVYISVITIGELRRGVDLIINRGDLSQGKQLNDWLMLISNEYRSYTLGIDNEIALLWGKLRVPHPENAIDKLIAATALIYDFTLVTRNTKDFCQTGVKLVNPFE